MPRAAARNLPVQPSAAVDRPASCSQDVHRYAEQRKDGLGGASKWEKPLTVEPGQAMSKLRGPVWMTAAQIAELGLPGMPSTPQGVKKRARIEGWTSQKRPGRGGGHLYLVSLSRGAPGGLVTPPIPAALAEAPSRPRGRPKGTSIFDRNPQMVDAIVAWLSDAKYTASQITEFLRTRPEFAELPSRRALQRKLAELEDTHAVLFLSLRDPDKAKSRYRLSLGQMDATVSYAHEMWEIDTTKVDVLCTDGRWSVLGIIDRWSRRARFMVVASESAQSVRRMLISTISAWGVMPAVLKTDNGSGFINATIKSALELLEIKLDPCLPGHPEDKPHVERLFGTFMRDRASILPGFAGHNVSDAQRLRAKAKKETGRAQIEVSLTGADLQRILDAWIDGTYHLRRHSTIKMSPLEKWQRSPQPARAAPSEDVLKLALSTYVDTVKVGKRGIRWSNGRYWSEALTPYLGRYVQIRRDEDDLGELFVFDTDGRFIDIAVNHERSGLSQQAYATSARRKADAFLAEAKAEARRLQRQFPIEQARQEVLRAEAERAGKLINLPTHTAEFSTPAIDSIVNVPGLDPEAHLPPLPVPIAPSRSREPDFEFWPVERKIAWTDELLAAAARGEAVDPADLKRATIYSGSSQYQSEKVLRDIDWTRPPANPGQRREVG